MKRSEINKIMREAEKFLASKQFILPEWANWSLQDWKDHKGQTDYITERMLGWDITDLGRAISTRLDFSSSLCAMGSMEWTRSPMRRKS